MSSQNNWNNPDMYYQQPQSGGPGHSGYSQNAAYGANAQYAGANYAYQPLPPTNTLAIIALVGSIGGWTFLPMIGSLAGIIMGHIARRQIRQSGERGDGMAVAALWVGYVGAALWILFWVVYIGIFVLIFGVAMVGAGSAG